MVHVTKPAFLEDAYLTACESKVIGITQASGIILDQTNFYATSGGQPGDTGHLEREDGSKLQIETTIYGDSKQEILLVPEQNNHDLKIGETIIGHINWESRYKLMQMHTACHLLSVICPYPITGAAVYTDNSRVDFDLSQASVNKEEVTEKLNQLIAENHPIYTKWINEEELDANPSIIKSKNVRPPRGIGKIRLVCIGENACIDSQPCGGTHVTETGEIGEIYIAKIEKKGKENRRFRIRFNA